mgnify:CR=1 FL=1
MKYTEMAQREIYNVISNYVWQLENGTMQLDKFDDETLTESQQDRLIKAMQKELGKMVNKLEKKGVIVF